MLVDGNLSTSITPINSSYFNVVEFGGNVSEGVSKFEGLTSESGRVLEDG